jgi:signal transduction histidine kinase
MRNRLTSCIRDRFAAAMLLLALSLAYYIAVRIGFAFTLAANAVSLLWMPNAVVLAALLFTPPRVWGWLLAAVLPAHLIAELMAGVPLLMASCWYVSNLSEALLGAAIIRAVLRATPRFDRLMDVSVFMLAAVLVAPVLTSFLDAGLVDLVGWRNDGDYWAVVRIRVLSNALTALIVPPLALTLLRGGLRAPFKARRAVQLEAVALVLVLCAVCIAAFHGSRSAGQSVMYACAPLPLLLWAAVRMGVGGVSACVAIMALFAITGTLRGAGPFVVDGPDITVLTLHIFLIIITSSVMLLAAALAELRTARVAALRREERLDLALRAARMGAWEWNLVTDTISWRWGMESGEVIADEVRSAAMLLAKVHEHDRDRVSAAMRAAREHGRIEEMECRFVCNGRLRWIRGFGKVQIDRDGMRHAMIGVCVDTTQRKQLESRQSSQRESLARLTRAATLGELTGRLAHELSQPLAAIMINSHTAGHELRKERPAIPELQAIVDDIAADDERATAVINRMRALFPRTAVEKESVHVAECIDSILALEHSGLITNNVAVDLNIDPALPPVIAAQAQLQQVLLNLVSNACEAMADKGGERRLRIAAERHSHEVRVAVSDNGSGVADFHRIFEPFYSTTEQGVGLGLPIARTIIGEHGGRLWGTNNACGGATFYICLPVAVTAPA